jgi:hypothetical protein
MEKNKILKGISRRESLRIGAGIIAGMATSSFSGMIERPGDSDEKISPQTNITNKQEQGAFNNNLMESSLDWIHDVLIITMPPAAIGGCQSGFYTPAENGIAPWGDAIIRWYTNSYVRGNGAVLVRQEGSRGGAGLSAIIDPGADYLFQVMVNQKDNDLPVWATVFDDKDRIVA